MSDGCLFKGLYKQGYFMWEKCVRQVFFVTCIVFNLLFNERKKVTLYQLKCCTLLVDKLYRVVYKRIKLRDKLSS